MAYKTLGLGDLLISKGLLTEDQLLDALQEQKKTRERLGEILVNRGWLTHDQVLEALGKQLGHEQFDPTRHEVQPEALTFVSVELARRYDVLPVSVSDSSLTVAMADPTDVEAQDQLRTIALRSGRELVIMTAVSDGLARTRDAKYGWAEGDRNVSQLIERVVDEVGELPALKIDEDSDDLGAEDAGIVSLVDQIVSQALQERATDIHIEPQPDGLVIRFRVDGILYDALTPPRAVYTGTISRLKIMSNMDIAERRAAQDGRFTHKKGGREVDVRVSSVPTVFGEKMVLRLLEKDRFNFSLKEMGLSEADLQTFRHAIHQPYGMILLSGPTGSGKTTTLYASLAELNDDTRNITTVEDPVEYQIKRINQVQVNVRKNLTFANALRAFLRQDPDVIMVGEIRDQETAEIAVRAALTGHMVFSTIHANDAPSTATRLVSMGSEAFMCASALTLVAAQRLVRRVCSHCQEVYEPDDAILLALESAGIGANDLAPDDYRRGRGCVACKGRGYQGRLAVLELMSMTPELRHLVAEARPATEIRQLALTQNMTTLKGNGLQKVREGQTTVEEVLRVCVSDE
ncbi:Flp pilus assembly complex ATPase component TadA [bacterium]|nr:Flp pilus assembly complex ATPase component TadA [bacterium]HPF36145.1 ATPase, T2SS/T4P/T4SS family [Candidatus Krumholzibacteria bacterium]HRX51930.1 ATPase, T2SS/T4P/T4SS family [Candidatus Krumholzibacteria bacterium]